MPLLDKFREELQEESNDKQTDMHTVYIGIGSNYNLVITQSIKSIFNIKCRLEKIKLLILVNHFLG